MAAGQLVLSASGQRWQFAPGSSAVVGRGADCQVVLSDTRVSRRHLEITWENGGWFVRDLGSANGTFQDGRRVLNEPVGAARAVRLGHATEGPLIELVVVETPPQPADTTPSSPPAPASPAASPPPSTPAPAPPAASPPPPLTPTPVSQPYAASAPQPPAQQSPPPPQQQSPPPPQQQPPPPPQQQPSVPRYQQGRVTPPPSPPTPVPPSASAPGPGSAPAPGYAAGGPPAPAYPGAPPSPHGVPQQPGPQQVPGPVGGSPPGYGYPPHPGQPPPGHPAPPGHPPPPVHPPQPGHPAPPGHPPAPGQSAGGIAVPLTGTIRIGRDKDNELVLTDLLVSRHHARIETSQYGLRVVDLGSSNRTFVNGVPINNAPLQEGDMLTVGRTRFVQTGGTLLEVRDEPAAELAIEALTFKLPDGKTLTNNVSFTVAGPRLVAVLGPSGAGKSTMLKLISGDNEPTGGQVRYQNVDVHTHHAEVKSRIGMVPQHTVAHQRLTARWALRYAAELRLSGDTTADERERRVDQVLGELGLTQHADTRVDRLSGGQQRRLAIGFELLTRTSLLLLDEPTSGLDPALAYEVMRLLRRLADEGRQVLVTTHDTAHLNLCDTVVVMANGGTLAYVGPPDGIAARFGTSEWPQIFSQLAAAHPPPPGPIAPRPYQPAMPTQANAPRRPGGQVGRQFRVLCRRHLRLVFADRGYAAFLGLMPVALAILALAVPGGDGLAGPDAMRLLVVLIVGATFMGMASSVRELVGERQIFRHERAAGLTAEAYLGSKLVILSMVAILQSVLLVMCVRLVRPGPDGAVVLGLGTLEIIIAVAATAVVCSVLGLLVSSAMTTVEQTTPPLVVAVMAQLVLCGGVIPVAGRAVLEQLSWLAPARWGYAAGAGTVDLNRFAVNDDRLWSHHPAAWLGSMAVLFVLSVIFALITLRLVRRR